MASDDCDSAWADFAWTFDSEYAVPFSSQSFNFATGPMSDDGGAEINLAFKGYIVTD